MMARYCMRYLPLLRCPRCGENDLQGDEQQIRCPSCDQTFAVEEGIPLLFWPDGEDRRLDDLTATVRSFYEQNPFPNYEDTDDLASLMDRAREGLFARLLDQQIAFKTRVLDCGCGTGQLTNFLGVAQRSLFGTDICLNSLKLAERFRRTHELDRVNFVQMNIFRPVFRPRSFDVIICNGVLHHTGNPEAGMASLARLLKPGGYLIIGLYHRYGRIATDIRRLLFRLTGDRLMTLDPRIRKAGLSAARRSAWFNDQYRNPHETKHTVAEVLRWLENHGLKFVKSLPKTCFGGAFSRSEKLFEPELAGKRWERALVEASQVFSEAAENGFFVVIAQSPIEIQRDTTTAEEPADHERR
jgi:2-polyprenyl-3-methyl-5-hydroxy-6-metoxy-1,4-benzoquinol methylase